MLFCKITYFVSYPFVSTNLSVLFICLVAKQQMVYRSYVDPAFKLQMVLAMQLRNDVQMVVMDSNVLQLRLVSNLKTK